jgi:antitoxin component of MazEF toxin-antitoxin module
MVELPPGRDTMRKRLVAIGNSLGIILEKPILELLNIQRETDLEMTTDGDALILRPIREERRMRVKAAARRVMDAHSETLRKLAR